MISTPPNNFKYTEETKNLFLFFQCLNEITFDFSPDSYKANSLNTHTLCIEAYNIYNYLLSDHNEKYFNHYIPDILDEIIYNLKNDNVAKALMDKRLNRYMTILEESKKNSNVFETNIRNILHFFDGTKYYNAIVKKLKELVCGKKNEREIIRLTNDFVCELIHLGYSKQHIYNVTIDFFQKNKIESTDVIDDYFSNYNFKSSEWKIITFVDGKLLRHYDTALKDIIYADGIAISNFSEADLSLLISKDRDFDWLNKNWHGLKMCGNNVNMIKANVTSLDPFQAYKRLMGYLKSISNFITIFDNENKFSFNKIACLNYIYKKTIFVKRPMEKRVRQYGQDYAVRAAKVLKKMNRMSADMTSLFMKMLSFHGDAVMQNVEHKYVLLMLWTALETLFVNNSENTNKAQLVKNSLVEIVQRTYIIKRIKYLQQDFIRHLSVTQRDLISKYNIKNIDKFIELLFDNDTSPRILEVGKALEKNPLLRSRVYQFVNCYLKNSDTVYNMLNQHRQKIEWQVFRIYRTRNLIVHSGRVVPYLEQLVENLHNYLDFIINYIICKTENDEAISNINDIVCEVQIDNELHNSMLKNLKGMDSKDKINELLFGPSTNVVDYYRDCDI